MERGWTAEAVRSVTRRRGRKDGDRAPKASRHLAERCQCCTKCGEIDLFGEIGVSRCGDGQTGVVDFLVAHSIGREASKVAALSFEDRGDLLAHVAFLQDGQDMNLPGM
jgi:hypothetical protein